MQRRTFLKTATASGLAGLAASRAILAADAEIELALQEPGAVISPHIYGHFIEHLGGVIYDGIWVGRNSKIPNVDGIRRRFVEDMQRLSAPNLRWPGGCFADGYHWRDGIGPAASRPRTYNYWRSTEPNQFGTHEFMRLCRLVGAEPYFAANVGSGSPQEFHDWVSYCNAPAGTLTLADQRAANGDKEPFNVQYWGVGNESWGCGGSMLPAEYAALYRQYTSQIPAYRRPYLVACGPRGHSADHDIGWTEGFLQATQARGRPDGLSLHFYTDFRQTKVSSINFNAAEWYEAFLRGRVIEKAITANWAVMAKYDPAHRIKFIVDEWGLWYAGTPLVAPSYQLSQGVTLRDALHAGITFDIFNRHADKVAMAEVAQTINCLHSLFLALEDKYTRTPAYYVFEMYRGHMGGRSVPMRIKVDELSVPVMAGSAKMAGLEGSASVRDKRVTVTLTNVSLDSPVTARIRLAGGSRAMEGRGQVLTHSDMRATNTFDRPDEVKLAPLPVTLSGDVVSVTVPKQSVVALELAIA